MMAHRKTNIKRVLSEKGQSLIEAMIILAIVAATAHALISFVAFGYKSLQRQRQAATLDRITTSVLNVAGMTATLRASVSAQDGTQPENEDLRWCAFGSPTDAPDCDGASATRKPMRLYGPMVEVIGSAGSESLKISGAITGMPAYPLRYNLNGTSCDTFVAIPGGASTCPPEEYPLEIFTEFRAICPPAFSWRNVAAGATLPPLLTNLNPNGSCPAAATIEIYLTIRRTPGSPDDALPFDIPSRTYVFPIEVDPSTHAF